MIFHASTAKPIDDNLKNLVKEIEEQSLSLSVLAARQFRYCLRQTPVELTIKEPRQFNVLEEFIIRAGIEFEPPPTADELASVLGLDPVFIQSTIATLQTLQTLAVTSPITVTAEGRLFYEKGTVPQPPYSVQVYAISDPLREKVYFDAESLNDVTTNFPDLAKFVTLEHKGSEVSSLQLEEVQQSIQTSDLALHLPDEGKIITAFRVIPQTKIFWRTISLYLIFDALEDKLSVQLRNGKQILESASNRLEALQAEGKISLQALCELSNETINFEREAILNQKNAEIESRLEKIRQRTLEAAQDKAGAAVQLCDRQIPQAFSEILNSAKRQILIYSPWVNQAVVDDKFLTLLQKLVNRGVGVLIGHGIARRQEDEARPISPEVEAKLRGVKTPEGLPGVQVFWLGDSHVKEVIVDQEIHLCGAHNWLDYRGEYLPTGESVYKVTIPEQVQEAYQFLAHRYQNYAQKLWESAIANHDPQLAVECLCIWGALGMEDLGIKEIEQHDWLELVPVWLNVVLHGLRSKNVLDDSAGLQIALSLLSQVSGEEAFVEPLRRGWRQVMEAIATYNHDTALNLLNNDVWAQFLRLNIALESDLPDKFISSPPKQKQKKAGK
ncbi:hypothetical protein NIES4074_08040 [Cylindrospermum sp. NIES-4074]|nr:hypothetical protein NIES4074_08040 [Cylindrospermum sp. NIES-4074]